MDSYHSGHFDDGFGSPHLWLRALLLWPHSSNNCRTDVCNTPASCHLLPFYLEHKPPATLRYTLYYGAVLGGSGTSQGLAPPSSVSVRYPHSAPCYCRFVDYSLRYYTSTGPWYHTRARSCPWLVLFFDHLFPLYTVGSCCAFF